MCLISDVVPYTDNSLEYDLLATDVMSTDDGSNLDIDCTQLYSLQLEDKLNDLTIDLEQEIDGGLCDEGAAAIEGSSKVFAALGNQVSI